MEIADNIGSLALSTRAKFIIITFVGALLAIDLVMMCMAIYDDKRYPSWVEASVYLFASLLPVALIVLVAAMAEGGEDGIRARTRRFMSHSLPRTLMHIGECGNAQADEHGPIRIETDQTPGSCLCRYRIYCGETLVLRFRLELNVRKANLVIVLPKEAIGPGRRGQQPITRVRHALAHSLSGAEAEGYGFNEVITSDDPDLIEPVFIIRLHDRFMLSAHERLYFAQDLMFFLKSIANELDLWPKQA